MAVTRRTRSGPSRGVHGTLAGMLGLLLITTVAVIPLTYTIVQSRQTDGLVIDLAGRQRMLLERYMKELLLAAEGEAPSYRDARRLQPAPESPQRRLRARVERQADRERHGRPPPAPVLPGPTALRDAPAR